APDTAVVRVPDLVRGPGQSAVVPLQLGTSAGVVSVTLKLRYDPALLQLTGATVAPGLPAGAAVALDTTATPGVAVVTFTSPALPAGLTDFVRLSAAV